MPNIETDLTTGNIKNKRLLFSIPFLLSHILQSIYDVVDMFVVGRYVGPVGISAINNGGQVINMLTNIIVGLCTGATVIVGQYYGASKKNEIQKIFQTLVTVLFILGFVIFVCIQLGANSILLLMKVPESSLNDTKNYLLITVCGIFFILGYNLFSAIMRGLGDSKNPLIFISIACFANIIFDFLLVGGLKLGVAGAALGTIFAQGISMICSGIFLMRNSNLFHKIKIKIDYEKVKMIFKVGIPISIQNVVINISFLVIAVLVNEIGVNASAAVGVVSKINNFAIMPAVAMGASISALVAQNIGASKHKRAKSALYFGTFITEIIGLIMFLIIRCFPKEILSFFSADVGMINAGMDYLLFLSIDFLFAPILLCLNGFLIGIGRTAFSSLESIMTSIGIRIPTAFLFGKILGWGIKGVGLAAPSATISGLIAALIFYNLCQWERNSYLVKNN